MLVDLEALGPTSRKDKIILKLSAKKMEKRAVWSPPAGSGHGAVPSPNGRRSLPADRARSGRFVCFPVPGFDIFLIKSRKKHLPNGKKTVFLSLMNPLQTENRCVPKSERGRYLIDPHEFAVSRVGRGGKRSDTISRCGDQASRPCSRRRPKNAFPLLYVLGCLAALTPVWDPPPGLRRIAAIHIYSMK